MRQMRGLIVFNDPDERRARLYTLETRGTKLLPDEDNPWGCNAHRS